MEILPATGSTNADLAERARSGAPAGSVLVTEHQTSGRGRLGRVWETPERACLTFSLLRRPELPPATWPWIPLAVGVAVHEVLRESLPGIGLKWPNDVLVDDRKLVGILVERIETSDGPAAVVGIGVNVSLARDELPVETATSLAIELDEAPDRTTLLAALLASLDRNLDRLDEVGSLRDDYVAACVTVGHEVRVELPDGRTLLGHAAGIDAQGQLLVATADGDVAVGAGDVVHVRSPIV